MALYNPFNIDGSDLYKEYIKDFKNENDKYADDWYYKTITKSQTTTEKKFEPNEKMVMRKSNGEHIVVSGDEISQMQTLLGVIESLPDDNELKIAFQAARIQDKLDGTG
jgi:hypothetical protein